MSEVLLQRSVRAPQMKGAPPPAGGGGGLHVDRRDREGRGGRGALPLVSVVGFPVVLVGLEGAVRVPAQQEPHPPHLRYRGTSLIRKRTLLGPCRSLCLGS